MEKIWLKSYPPEVPQDIKLDPHSTLVEMFAKSCEKFSAQDAFDNFGTRLTYQEVWQLSGRFAAYLQGLGLKKGERVAVILPNILAYPLVLIGILRAGLVAVNFNPLYTARELKHQLEDAEVSVVVGFRALTEALAAALQDLHIPHVVIADVTDVMSLPKSLITRFFMRFFKGVPAGVNIPGAKSLREILLGSERRFKPVHIDPQDIALLQYTGGTTGVAKGAVLTHANLMANVEQAHSWICSTFSSGQEIIITALPLYHIFSFTANFLLFFKLGAMNVLVTNPKDFKHFLKLLAQFRFTAITGVNTLFKVLLQAASFRKLDFSALKLALGGGMAVQRSVAEQWQEVTSRPLLEAYGLTETSPAAIMSPFNLKAFNGSIGLPLPSTDIRIVNEAGEECAINEPGELQIKGPQVLREYWKKPEETKQILTHDNWLKTGDIALVKEDGFVVLLDRKKDMILVSGFNVYPNEIESVVAEHPGVADVAAIGVLDQRAGEAMKLYVVKRDPSLTETQLKDFCRANLVAYKCPRSIEFLPELPKTAVGKVARRILRERAKEEMLAAQASNAATEAQNDD